MEIVRIDGRFRLGEKLSSGSSHMFAEHISLSMTHRPGWIDKVYLAHNILSKESVVLKLKPLERNNHTLEHEFSIYKRLNGGTGIPFALWFGTESGIDIMALNHLGPSLQTLFICSGFQFTIKTVLLLARQLVSTFDFWGYNWWVNMCYVQLRHLQYIHFCNFIHCDLKPSNIVLGVGNQMNLVYLIDFGLLKEFWDPNIGPV